MFDSKSVMDALIAGDKSRLTGLVQNALEKGVAANEILNKGLIAGMDIVGEKMESGEMFIPEVLRSAKVMGAAVGILTPLLSSNDMAGKGKVIIGTVKGDLHDIGKNLVSMMIESSGFKVYDLGVDVSPEKFVEAIRNGENPEILCLSALLTTTMPMMKETIDAVAKSGLRDRIKIMVGGAPVTQKFADEISADGYATDAGAAAKLAKVLLQKEA